MQTFALLHRSHAILTFHVESRLMNSPSTSTAPVDAKPEMRIGKIHLVDLAGSERLDMSGAEGETLTETKNINSSLTTLGDVLSALSKNATAANNQLRASKASMNRSIESSFDRTASMPSVIGQVPYRNSKLTHLLKDSLGGNSKTIMITNIRKSNSYYQQTHISLMYASRAKKVRNRSSINYNVIGDSAIHTVNTEIERLKKSMEERSNEFERLRVMQMQDARENNALKSRLQEMSRANEAEKKLFEQQVSQVIHSHAGYLASQKEKVATLQVALQEELIHSQNRIAEQEKEIIWLKKALDESNQFASHDQVAKMQHAIEVWQNQAKNAHHELTVVLGQAEELKTLNSGLQAKIQEIDSSRRQLSDELNERGSDYQDMNDKLLHLIKERDAAVEQQQASLKAFEEARNMMKDQLHVNMERDHVISENAKLITTLEQEVNSLRDKLQNDTGNNKVKLHQLTTRNHELEQEKVELSTKLNTAIVNLEKKSQLMIEDSKTQLQDRERQLHDLELQNAHLREEIERLRTDYQEIKSVTEVKLTQKNQAIEDLDSTLRRELQAASSRNAHILTVEGENEGLKHQISVLQVKFKSKDDAHVKAMNDLQSIINEHIAALQQAKESKEHERQTLMSEFERILLEKRTLHQQEIAGMQEHLTRNLATKDIDFQLLKERHEVELKERENAFQNRLRQTEEKVRALIETEINNGVSQLEEQHKVEISKLKDVHQHELQEAHHALREMLLRQKEEALLNLETKLNNIHEANLAAELQAQKQRLLEENHEKTEELLLQYSSSYEDKIRMLEVNTQQMIDDAVLIATEKLRIACDSDKRKALAELESFFTSQHGELLLTSEDRHREELRKKDTEHLRLMNETVAIEIKKAVDHERHLLLLQAEEERERTCNELKTRLLIEHNTAIHALRQQYTEEKLKQIRETEFSSHFILEEKDSTIIELNNQIKQLTAVHRDELTRALFEQEKEIIAGLKHELEKIRQQYAESEILHQAEINRLFSVHTEELKKTRELTEENAEKVSVTLRDELVRTREKLTETLELLSLAQAQEQVVKIEHRRQIDDVINKKLSEGKSFSLHVYITLIHACIVPIRESSVNVLISCHLLVCLMQCMINSQDVYLLQAV